MPEPFKPHWFHILLALANECRHGYGIQREVLDRTEGALTLWPAMLYRSLAALTARGLIEPAQEAAGQPKDARRQYYRITPAGRLRLEAEAGRLAQLAELARQRNPVRLSKQA